MSDQKRSMRKETVIFGLIAIGLIAFFVGRMAGPAEPERPATPSIEAVRPPTTAVVPEGEPGAKGEALVDPSAAPGKAGARAANPRGALPRLATEDPTGSPAMGPTEGRVNVVIVSDFQCPYCRRVEPTLKRLMREYRGDVRLIWKNNPLPFHDRARPAAMAALAAHRQGKFWAYHDRLFEEKGGLSDAELIQHARDLGLDVDQFRKDMKDPELAAQIDREQAAARKLGAGGTPTFFVNGKKLVGAKPYSEFKAYVDEARVEADEAIRAGTPIARIHEVMAAKNHPQGDEFVALLIRGEEPGEAAAGTKAAAKTRNQKRAAKPKARRPSRPVPQTVWKVTVDPDDPMKGAKDGLVTIVEFSDFQCPYCSRVNPTVKQILETFPDDVRVVWKNNPLPFHKHAALAAQAAMAAHAQGKFWEYHDLLFANQRALTRSDLERYAEKLGLDMAKFRKALDEGTYEDDIAADQALAGKVNARGTPNLFVNGRQIVGARPFEDFEPVIREELAKAKKLAARGLSPQNVYNQIILKGKTFQALDETVQKLSAKGPTKGKADAPIVITEFSDFQCPYCSRVSGPIEQLQELYPDRVKVVFKNFPLTSIHPNAQLAAEAALEADAQGKFWEFHDLLFQNQKALSRDGLEKYAEKVGLDMDRFRKALDEGKWKDEVAKHVQEGRRAGVRGTPSIYINGRKFQPAGGISVEALKKVIDTEFGK